MEQHNGLSATCIHLILQPALSIGPSDIEMCLCLLKYFFLDGITSDRCNLLVDTFWIDDCSGPKIVTDEGPEHNGNCYNERDKVMTNLMCVGL
jgi:hypothetical protein